MTKINQCPNCDVPLLGRHGLAAKLGVSVHTLDSWRTPKPGRTVDPPFPDPSLLIENSPVWMWETVKAWLEASGRPLEGK